MNYARCIYQFLKWKVYAPWKVNHYPSYSSTHSQFGEDAYLASFLKQQSGFYVDIGAHHPVFLSNTYHFYQRGWKGINIDATPGVMDLFKLMRPRDINIQSLVTDDEGDGKKYDFYTFDAGSLNSIHLDISEKFQQTPKTKHLLEGRSINRILEENLPVGQNIDFLNIDVEGLDEKILKALDLKKYRPNIILFEDHGESKALDYLKSFGYRPLAQLAVTTVMIEESYYETLSEFFKVG